MNASDFSHVGKNDSEWQLLGELELPAGAELDGTIQAWLSELLDPLLLHEDFLNRLLKSAQEVVTRSFQGDVGRKTDHIHLVIHGPREQKSSSGSWGFFHVEKVVNSAEETSAIAHSIEFYLYVEGRS